MYNFITLAYNPAYIGHKKMETLMIDNNHQSNIIYISFTQNKTPINMSNVYSVVFYLKLDKFFFKLY